MKRHLTDNLRINHVLDAIEEIEQYLRNVSFEQFNANSEKKFATIKQIEIIGEACNRITPKIKTTYSEIPWHAIKGFRNISIHEYFDFSPRLVWQITQIDLPILKKQFEFIRAEMSTSDDQSR